jgi:hypothetical protein
MTVPRLVGLCGHAGSGKSAAAQFLAATLGFRLVKLAGPLKDMLRAIGLGDRELEGDRKESQCGLLCGCTPRRAMQTLGTEWGREMIHPAFWLNLWLTRARSALESGGRVVTDDVRTPKEVGMIQETGGVVLCVVRPGVGPAGGHDTERDLSGEPGVVVVRNDGDLGLLCRRVAGALGVAA